MSSRILPPDSERNETYNDCTLTNGFKICQLPESVHALPHIDVGTDTDVKMLRKKRGVSKRAVWALAKSLFNATIVGDVTPSRTRAIAECMRLAGQEWPSEVPVHVHITFRPFAQNNMLGSAASTSTWLVADFVCSAALASAILKYPVNEQHGQREDFEIIMTLNSNANWYLGVDGNPSSGTYDLVTVCLHEVYHGLFMTGYNLAVQLTNEGEYHGHYLDKTQAGRFEAFLANQDGCNLKGYVNQSNHLGTALTGNNLWFVSGSEVVAKLHAPRPFEQGSSWYHLSESQYGSGEDGNDLMTPVISTRYAQHQAGPIVTRMMQVLLDVRNQLGAKRCDNMSDPVIGNLTIGGGGNAGSGGNSNGGYGSEGSSFLVKLGDAVVSGWIFVGAGIAAVVILASALLIVRSVMVKAAGGGRSVRPPRRIDPQQARLNNTNGGGLR